MRKIQLRTDSRVKSNKFNYFLNYLGGSLLQARYHDSTVFRFLVLAEYWCNIGMDTGVVLARPLMITRLGVGSQYWATKKSSCKNKYQTFCKFCEAFFCFWWFQSYRILLKILLILINFNIQVVN